jgi:hypothetical protein
VSGCRVVDRTWLPSFVFGPPSSVLRHLSFVQWRSVSSTSTSRDATPSGGFLFSFFFAKIISPLPGVVMVQISRGILVFTPHLVSLRIPDFQIPNIPFHVSVQIPDFQIPDYSEIISHNATQQH